VNEESTSCLSLTIMPMQLSAVRITTSPQERPASGSRNATAAHEAMSPLAVRVHGEYREMPGLRLTVRQAARLFGVAPDVADAVLHELRRASILTRGDDGAFSLIGEASGRQTEVPAESAAVKGALGDASLDRLACLLRHWTWANEAMARFDRELADGWKYDEDPMSDHPFGAYYHWCALLCAFGEAALDHGLLSPSQLEPIRHDIEASLPGIKACRQLLVVIPDSIEKHPRIVDLLRDGETLPRLRRIHQTFGEALRKEHVSREIDSLDP
jgi:hypothetical protein